jgi:hypothetical protein
VWLQLPKLRVERIKAKVDTGARSSALHAIDIEVVRGRGPAKVRFRIHPLQDDFKKTIFCEALLHDERWVKSSNGKRELRPVIRTSVSFLDQTWDIDLTLTSRDLMGFRMLLGREAVRRRFLVDPGRSFLGQKRAKAKLLAQPKETSALDLGASASKVRKKSKRKP